MLEIDSEFTPALVERQLLYLSQETQVRNWVRIVSYEFWPIVPRDSAGDDTLLYCVVLESTDSVCSVLLY